MVLIVGGAWQGKLTYAMEQYRLTESECLDLEKHDPVPGYRCYYHLESWTKRCEDPKAFADLFKNAIVITREIGSGVVPMEQGERFWRERHGRFLRVLSKEAEQVIRIFCGLPEVLK